MKKQTIALVSATAILGGNALLSSSVLADDTSTPVSSDAKVEFTAPDPGEEGALSLTAVPAIDFGSQEISAQDKSYTAQGDAHLTIQDNRGTAPGWHVNVSASNFVTASGKELKGTTITFANGAITSNDETSKVEAQKIEITPGGTASTALNATVGNGNSETDELFSAKAIQLNVPGSSSKVSDKYTSTMTWSLVDAPL